MPQLIHQPESGQEIAAFTRRFTRADLIGILMNAKKEESWRCCVRQKRNGMLGASASDSIEPPHGCACRILSACGEGKRLNNDTERQLLRASNFPPPLFLFPRRANGCRKTCGMMTPEVSVALRRRSGGLQPKRSYIEQAGGKRDGRWQRQNGLPSEMISYVFASEMSLKLPQQSKVTLGKQTRPMETHAKPDGESAVARNR